MDDSFSPLGRSIGRANKFLQAWWDRELAPIGASVTECILLGHIKATPDLSQTEIARYCDMGGPAMARHLERMERDGLVSRTRDAVDRRVIRVGLTPAGEARLEDVAVVMSRCDRQIRDVLADEEQAALHAALDKVFRFALGELHGPLQPSANRPAIRSAQ